MIPFRAVIAAVLLASVSAAALAIEDRADLEPNQPVSPDHAIAWKLTPSLYRETAGPSAFDLNLRGNRENDTFWIGHYQQYEQGSDFQQTRAGYELQFSVPFGRIIASGQYATGGFLGGSVTFEASMAGPWVGLLGWGRTNLKPYYNLTFDPNDSVLIGAGWRPDDETAVTVFQIRDDRLGTGQQVTHFVLRQKTGTRSRLTLDLFNRAGRSEPDAEWFRATGIAITYDREPWFVRFAWDPKANYTDSDMARLAIGARF